ncbi:hypothetical protein KY325_00415 [Candidatus Woesearchaeota archaeon]|nr:hypothetical protein [Candidatus Woesearchaeota archaeon]MBW3017608.1 hypothetical protein [Candidatus Woesearchaeota archaeon]
MSSTNSRKIVLFAFIALVMIMLFLTGCLMPPDVEQAKTDAPTGLSVQEIDKAVASGDQECIEDIKQKCAELLEVDLNPVVVEQPQTVQQPPIVNDPSIIVVEAEQETQPESAELVEQLNQQNQIQIVYDENLSLENS